MYLRVCAILLIRGEYYVLQRINERELEWEIRGIIQKRELASSRISPGSRSLASLDLRGEELTVRFSLLFYFI